MTMFFNLVCYTIVAYGFANMIVYANGPFHIFRQWREFAMDLNEKFGELFTCMMCISTWIGFMLSLANQVLLPELPFTPFNMIMEGNGDGWLAIFLDMGLTSGIVWILHQFEEMLERVGYYGEIEE